MNDKTPEGAERTGIVIAKAQYARVKRIWPDASVSAVTRRALNQYLDQAEAAAAEQQSDAA